jgi:hypothetical protein
MHAKTALLSFALMLGASGAAQATTTVYTDRDAYLAAISGAATDTFDDLGIQYYGTSMTRTVGDYSYQLSANPDGLYGAGENGDGWISTNSKVDEISFSNFTGGVSAIGGYFFGSNANGGYADVVLMSLSFLDRDGVETAFELPSYPTESTFFGFVSSTGLQSLTIGVPGFPSDGMTPEQIAAYQQWPTANDIILGQSPQDAPPPPAVPEPASWALMLAGFGLVGGALRGRRTAAVSFG